MSKEEAINRSEDTAHGDEESPDTESNETDPVPPSPYSKAWVRRQYDSDREVATRGAQLAKLLHEWHIALPGVLLGMVPAAVVASTGASIQRVLLTYFGVFGTAYGLFFKQLWCSTLAEPTTTDDEA